MNQILEDISKKVLENTENVELILVYGSYAFGEMKKFSDIDMLVVTKRKKRKTKFSFVKHEGRNILLTIDFQKFSEILKKLKDAENWVWSYKAYTNAWVLYDKNKNIEKLKKALEENIVTSDLFLKKVPKKASFLPEYVGKLKNAYLSKDELNVIYAARCIAEICADIIRPFNPVWRYKSESETYSSYLELENKPKHYVDDFKTCYGLTMKKLSPSILYRSAIRLANETVSFLRSKDIEKLFNDKEFLQFFNSEEYADCLKSDIS